MESIQIVRKFTYNTLLLTLIRAMKKTFTPLIILLFYLLHTPFAMQAQCGPGYSASQLNWDYLDYMTASGSYSGFVTNAMAGNQNFTIGPNRVNIRASATNFTLAGENALHTGNLAGFTGQDVQYTPIVNGDSIVIIFDQPVTNARLALYDIDNAASFTVSARNAANAALNPTVTLQASTILAVGGVATAVTVGTASVTNLANNSNQGTAIITVAGPVKVIKIVITARGNDPVFWMSDINACVTGSFPNSYRVISRPFTGMPAYVIVVNNNNFMLLDPNTGRTKPFFTDPGAPSHNSLAYDPYNRILYYTYNRSGAGGVIDPNNRTIRKYSVDAETIGVLTTNVTTSLGIPVFDNGLESAAASFHGGYYYTGVEGYNAARNSGRENTIWRIEFDAAQNAIRASQVYSARADSFWNSSDRLRHDWSDFGVSDNNMLYDFDGAGGDEMYYHFNLMTGQRTEFVPSGAGYVRPNQVAINWKDSLFNEGGTSGLSAPGFVAPYNYNGTIDATKQFNIFTNPGPVYPTGNWADAAEAYRPLCDFGDAPVSYDPDPWSPAVHERDTALRIGPTFDREWNKTSSVLANADGADEDGLAYVPIFSPTAGNYLAQVSVYNNTGVNATLIAWLDFNGNGAFDAGETCQPLAPIPSSAATQNRYLYWPSAPSSLPFGSFTYLRIRLTKTVNGMTAANATGYYEDGETEDYRITVDNFPLSVNLQSFNAKLISDKNVELKWTTTAEENFTGFEIQRSTDNINWLSLGMVYATGNGSSSVNEYVFNDLNPAKGRSYYRLKMISSGGEYRNSNVAVITIRSGLQRITLSPNPAAGPVTLTINSSADANALISIIDISGKVLYKKEMLITKGSNSPTIPFTEKLDNGIYMVRVNINEESFVQRLVIAKK